MRLKILLTTLLLCPTLTMADEVNSTWLQPAAFTTQQWEHTWNTIETSGLTDVYLRAPAVYNSSGQLLGGGAGSDENFRRAVADLVSAGIGAHAWLTNGRRLEEQQLHSGGWPLPIDESLFVDFSAADEQAAQAAWCVAVLQQNPDLAGCALDYIRGLTWSDPDPAYTDSVTETVCAIYTAVQSLERNRKVSAAIFAAGAWPSSPGYQHVQQDPVEWINRGCIDWVTAMQYVAAKPEVMRSEVASWQQLVTDTSRVHFAGGHYYPAEAVDQEWGPMGGEHPQNLANIIPVVRDAGLGGFSIYTLGIPGREASERHLVEVLGPILAQ